MKTAGSVFMKHLTPLPVGNWLTALLVILLLMGLAYSIIRIIRLRSCTNYLKNNLDSNKVWLEQLIEEREFLIHEIHHRVKNNLQIMMSLLNMQSSYLTSEEAASAIKNSSHRLFAISLVYQKLYQTENLSSIDFSVYLRELGQYLQYEFNRLERVTLSIDADPLCLDVTTAIPLGLIVHEALSNAFKHGFRHGGQGSVSIFLRSEDSLHYLLQITDNGVGFPEGFKMQDVSSLGQRLMTGLSGQLQGKLAIRNHKGVTVSLVFPKEINPSAGNFNNHKTQ